VDSVPRDLPYPLGFQVTARGLPGKTSGLIADFASLAEAEAFAASMRQIDAERTYSMASKDLC
jgi:hypothetical protein